MVTFDNPIGMSAPNARYSHVAVVDLGPVRMLILAGQVPMGDDDTLVGIGDFSAQAQQAFDNVARILAAHGAELTDIVKTVYYVTDMNNRPLLAAVRNKMLGEHLPTSTLLEVSGLASPDFLVEIEVTAIVEKTDLERSNI